MKTSGHDQSGKSSYYQNIYKTMKDYFLELTPSIYVKLKKTQSNIVDNAPESKPWMV